MSSVTSSGIGVKTIDHITIVVKDLKRSAQFYSELLAMEAIQRPDFGFPGLWFQAGGTKIHMNVAGKEAGSAGFPRQDAECASRGFHYAFEVEDCDVAADLIRKQGIEIVEGPQSRPDGARQLYIRDPDGHLVEICSLPTQQTATQRRGR